MNSCPHVFHAATVPLEKRGTDDYMTTSRGHILQSLILTVLMTLRVTRPGATFLVTFATIFSFYYWMSETDENLMLAVAWRRCATRALSTGTIGRVFDFFLE